MSEVEIVFQKPPVAEIKFKDLESGDFFDWAIGDELSSPILRKIGQDQYTMIGGLPCGDLFPADPFSMVIPLDVQITARVRTETA